MTRRAALALALLAVAWGPRGAAAARGEPLPPPRLFLVFPNSPTGTTLETRRPRFVWSSEPVAVPPGPWLYDLEIVNAGTGERFTARQLSDTTFTPGFDLESNTSYRWAVTARLSTGDSVRVASLASFVIVDANAPIVTLLYQNFPNPFPTSRTATTCVWFDLSEAERVRLDVYDLRGSHVRTLVPSPEVGGQLPAGRYGRATGGSGAGCDGRFAWDGRGDDGREAARGVYLLRLRAGRVNAVRRMLYMGR